MSARTKTAYARLTRSDKRRCLLLGSSLRYGRIPALEPDFKDRTISRGFSSHEMNTKDLPDSRSFAFIWPGTVYPEFAKKQVGR